MIDFPTILYRCPGVIRKNGGHCNGAFYDVAPANNTIELHLMQAKGWFTNFEDAYSAHYGKKEKPAEPVESKVDDETLDAMSREELEEKATAIGIKFDGRTSTNKLKMSIRLLAKE